MILPTDLQHDVADRVAQPGFDAVLDRAAASRRRRRTTIASGLATAVVVGGLGAAAGGLVGADDASPDPTRPATSTPWDGTSAPDERLPSSVRAVLDDDQVQLWSIAGGEGGAQVALWRGCDFDPCQFALVTRDGDGVFGEVLGASFPTVTPVPGGWLVQDARGTFRLSPAGDRSEIFDTGPGSGDVMAGDTAVPTVDGWRLLRGDKLVPLPAQADRRTYAAHVTADGRLVAVTGTGTGPVTWISTTDDGRNWENKIATRATEKVSSAVVAGSGDHVAVALSGDDPSGGIPLLDVQVSHDGGTTWASAAGVVARSLDTMSTDRVRNMSALAVGADGTAYLTTESHHLLRIDDEGFVTPIQLSAFESGVFASGDDVCVVVERGRYDALVCSSDGLTEWADQPLPGLG
ncbi:hypothetical protein [Nocardioides zhouii]|uniref:Exo-alpha-sialidase n=1 Tax=Nocardioides zhouii TaxID=1168729 RepID=A0A4Q2SZN9_9ACTN|nr:hypothetical protein [Nocardioides zhouii]RYC11193.1 hypothetical protein EUA94_09410 [Nocardioides zhouii]